MVPRRHRAPSPNRSILDPQASSTPLSSDPPDTQPLASNSPSSNIYSSIVIDPTRDEAPGRIINLASTGFQGVRMALGLIESTADVFPPLKSAVAGLLGVINIVEVRGFRILCR